MSSQPLFCYCFEIPLDQARAEPEATVAAIQQRITTDGCWCSEKNPSGKCCMSEMARLEAGQSVSTVAAVSAGVGAAALATAASACCVPILAPLLVTVLGVGGSIWAASLAPYSVWIVLLSGLVLGWGGWMIYRPRLVSGAVCASRPSPLLRVAFWFSVALWLLALGVNMVFKLGGSGGGS